MPNILMYGNKGINLMSLNVNYTSLYKQGIDTSVLKEVSKEILNRAAQKNTQYTNNINTNQITTIAKPVELGVDLYQCKIDINAQKQIAMNNALQLQLNNETLKSIQFLNSQAAIANRVEGKITPAVNEVVTETQKVSDTNKSKFISIFTSATAKDREGSNPFYNGELLMNNKGSKEEQQAKEADKLKNIFA